MTTNEITLETIEVLDGQVTATIRTAGFRPGAFAKTARERAGKAPVLDEHGARLGTITTITEDADAVRFTIAADEPDALFERSGVLRFRPVTADADEVREVAVWEIVTSPPGPSIDLLRRREWLAAHSEGTP